MEQWIHSTGITLVVASSIECILLQSEVELGIVPLLFAAAAAACCW
jgi:hypothetical protein